MKNKIKYTCEVCKHVAFRQNNWKTFLFGYIKFILIVGLMVTSLLGSMGLYNFFVGEIYDSPDKVISLGQAYALVLNEKGIFQSNEDTKKLRTITDDIIGDCIESECKAKAVYNHLLLFPYLYENATELNPLKVWDDGEGDCDQISVLFMALLKTHNIKSRLDCSTNHCWNILYLEDKKVIVDIVNRRWSEYNE